jgi:hypothetical protein
VNASVIWLKQRLNTSTDKPNYGLVIRYGLLVAFLFLYLKFGSSGAFLFDNALIGNATLDWDWLWAKRLESAYEWTLLAAIMGGLYLFVTFFRNGLPKQVNTRQMLVLVAAASIFALLYSLELREYKAQQALVEEFERQGGCILLRHHSVIISGYWYETIALSTGLMCSITGGAIGACRMIGIDSFDWGTHQITKR